MRQHRDWQFFNRRDPYGNRLVQACYSGHLWSFGFGTDPARIWIGRLSRASIRSRYALHFHTYLPFNSHGLPWRPTFGYRRRNGDWVNVVRCGDGR